MNAQHLQVMLALVGWNLIPAIWLRPLWVTLFAVVLFGVRLFLNQSRVKIPIPRWSLWILQVTVGLTVWLQYQSIFGDEAAGSLLTLLMCLKAFELKTRRDYFICLMLCWLVMMSYLLLDQSLLLTVFLIADVVLVFAGLRIIQMPQWDWSQWREQIQATVRVGFKALPIAFMIFVLFPRFSTGFGTGQETRAKMGITDQLRPGSVSQLVNSDELVFRASFLNGEIPVRKSLYWRGVVLSVSSGLSWDRQEKMGGVRPKPAKDISHDAVEIYLEPGFERFLFTLENTETLNFPSEAMRARVLQLEGDTFALVRPLQSRERYYLQMQKAGQATVENYLKPYLQTPGPASDEIERLLRPTKERPVPEKVDYLLRHFESGGFAYSLTPPRVRDLDDFLFNSKQGFCEHYAGSMATLLRYAGVPARVVTGFQGGTLSFLQNYVSIRAHDAHAWVEYYDQTSERWRRVDPTLVVAPTRISQGSTALLDNRNSWAPTWIYRAQAVFDDVEAAWIGFLIRFDLSFQKEILSRMHMDAVLFRALPVFLILGLMLSLAILYFLEMRKREARRPMDQLYRDLLRSLRRRGFLTHAHEGPMDLIARLRTQRPELAARFEPLLAEVTLGRYANVQLNSKEVSRLRRKIKLTALWL